MLKKVLFAMVPLALVATISVADDDLLDGFDRDNLTAAEIEVDQLDATDLDFDALDNEAGAEEDSNTDEAIEACFRRYGYRSYGYGYRYGGYPVYRSYTYHNCYSPLYTYRPVYHHSYFVPTYSHYWGCY